MPTQTETLLEENVSQSHWLGAFTTKWRWNKIPKTSNVNQLPDFKLYLDKVSEVRDFKTESSGLPMFFLDPNQKRGEKSFSANSIWHKGRRRVIKKKSVPFHAGYMDKLLEPNKKALVTLDCFPARPDNRKRSQDQLLWCFPLLTSDSSQTSTHVPNSECQCW